MGFQTRPQNYITNSPPKDYTQQSLGNVLHQKLTPEEQSLVVNPLTDSPEMNRWAYQLTAGATNDLQKAKMIFDVLIQHTNYSAGLLPKSATAQEVFADWNNPNAPVYCEQATALFVTLARAVGLKAYVVWVDEAYDGNMAAHVCSALFVGNKALLVDPAYSWFGAPHKKFIVLDDLQTVALHLSTLSDLRQKQIAQKLAPDLALVQYNLCNELMNLGRGTEARELLPTVIRLDADGAMADSVQARFAIHDGKLEQAIDLLNKAIKINSYDADSRIQLGYVYQKQGRSSEAHESFQNALSCPHTEYQAEAISRYMTQNAK
jgi:hypothetical protein